MTRRSIDDYLMKANRVTGFCLLGMMPIYVCTGLAMLGKFRIDHLIPMENALALHKNMLWPLVVVFLSHGVISTYFAMRRWGWIGKTKLLPPAQPSGPTP